MAIAFLRLGALAVATWAGFALGAALGRPGAGPWLAAGGLGLGILAVLLEWRARAVSVHRLFWGAVGAAAGLALGLGFGTAIGALVPGAGPLAHGLLGLLLAYLGLAVTLAKRDDLDALSARLFPRPESTPEAPKILDTSVIIDGRIAEVFDAGFLDGPLVVPRFVLRELQQIADSPDALRRNRGKRGFDVLQRLQQRPGAAVQILDRDVPGVSEVDDKLVELARTLGGRIVTNDYNLSRVAELSGVTALNLADLANAVKPVALPGETMQLHVLREGKEAGQGVAYLADGTMVVVDNGRKLIGQTVGVTVTSVLQTTAGRMIFARATPAGEQGGR